jgi:hypothetical protein
VTNASPSEVKCTRGHQPQATNGLKNSLLASVGLLELANAGDFAANVSNEIPVPTYAAALMAVGGTLALTISLFAFKDAELSQRNILLLRKERRYLRTQIADHAQKTQIARDVDGQLNVNFRELGTELVDRIGMDMIMGLGAVLVACIAGGREVDRQPTAVVHTAQRSGWSGLTLSDHNSTL